MASSLDDFLNDDKKNIQKKNKTANDTTLKTANEEKRKKKTKKKEKREDKVIPLDQLLIQNKTVPKPEKKQLTQSKNIEKEDTINKKKVKDDLNKKDRYLQREKKLEREEEIPLIKEDNKRKTEDSIEKKKQFNIVSLSLIKRAKKRAVLKPLNVMDLIEAVRTIPGYKNRLSYTVNVILNNNSKITAKELAVLLSISEGEAAVILRDAKLQE